MSKILLTGATGFIGQHLYQSLGDNIRCVIRKKEDKKLFKDTFLVSSIDSTTDWANAFDNIDTVIHLAGVAHKDKINKELYQEINVEGTVKLAKQAALSGVKRFIFISSSIVLDYFNISKPLTEENVIKSNINDYAYSKYQAELKINEISLETGMDIVIIRPSLVYGKNAPGNFKLLVNLVKKLKYIPFGLIQNKRDFISIDNLVSFIKLCITHPNAKGQTFNITDNDPVSIKELTNRIANALNKNIIQIPVPIYFFRLGYLLGKKHQVNQLTCNFEINTKKAKTMLNWMPPYSMQQSLQYLKEDNE